MAKLFNKFIIVIPTRNARDLISQCLRSVLAQQIDDCGIIIRDDISSDETSQQIENIIKIDGVKRIQTRCFGKDVIYIRNSVRLFGGGNTYDSVIRYVGNFDSIIGVVDGDDYLIGISCLQKIFEIYASGNFLLVWSQHQAKSKLPQYSGCSGKLPSDELIYSSRNYWSVSHFRTCKAWLFHQIRPEDLMDPFVKNSYCMYACDAALLYPIIEMVGNRYSYFLDEILYFYNDEQPDNEVRTSEESVQRYSEFIRRKKIYKPLTEEVFFKSVSAY